ncbi:hypothetical protein MKX83_24075 [Cytobacillus sp. FSL M8-0252]|uniref:hypothetical protein n=1 Tax=Cytobacillus sp. FSL M8-0252 TaxID=2921621 RepID=UPI0030FA094F
MITCKYCGQEVKFIGESDNLCYFDCTFCELIFPLDETSVDRKRKLSVPKYYDYTYYVPTKHLLERDTITLYHLLKDVRESWYSIKKALENLKLIEDENILSKPKDDEDDLIKQLKREFIDLSKRRYIIENILLERTGYFPPKITQEFLNNIIEQGRIASNKPMFVYIN